MISHVLFTSLPSWSFCTSLFLILFVFIINFFFQYIILQISQVLFILQIHLLSFFFYQLIKRQKPLSSSQCASPTSFSSLIQLIRVQKGQVFCWKTIPLKTEAHNEGKRILENKTHLKGCQKQQVNNNNSQKTWTTMEETKSNMKGIQKKTSDIWKVMSWEQRIQVATFMELISTG